MVRTTGIEPVRASPRDFKSLASTSSATSAALLFKHLAIKIAIVAAKRPSGFANSVPITFSALPIIGEGADDFCLIFDVPGVVRAHAFRPVTQGRRNVSGSGSTSLKRCRIGDAQAV